MNLAEVLVHGWAVLRGASLKYITSRWRGYRERAAVSADPGSAHVMVEMLGMTTSWSMCS